MSELTYPEVGATRDAVLPSGYRHLRYRTELGRGEQVLRCAGEAVLTFAMHRGTGARIRTQAQRAAPGVRLTVGLGPLTAPCEVVWVTDDAHRCGFGYGTLPGHPARGEEAFVVHRDDAERVWFTVTAFSVPARWIMRLGGPAAVLAQHGYARRCGQVLSRLCATAR